MTNNQHGQVPEALIDLIDAYAETRHRYGRIHNAKTEAARNAVIEALSGVQALSAAPEAIAKLRHLYQNMVNGAVRDTASAKRIAEGLLAPAIEALERATPPAEQQAAQVIIDFSQVGTAGPFPVANGRVSLPDATMQDLARMLRPTYEAEQQAAPKAAPGDAIDEAMRERDDAEDFIDALLDEVLGHERPEWSSSYGRADALNDVQERMTALHKPAVDKAWGQFQSAMAAPQQEAQEPTEIPEEIERMAADRYKVVPSHESMFHRWTVVAGTGTQQLYLGREVECQNMARKFAGAFLDGAFVAMQRTAPQPAPASLSDDVVREPLTDEAARKQGGV